MIELRHIGITVTDIDKSLHFYRDLLGFEIAKQMDEEGEYIDNFSGLQGVKVTTIKMISGDRGMIELLHYKSHPESSNDNLNKQITRIGCSHFAVTVNYLNSLYEKMKDNGVKFNSPPQKSPDGKFKIAFCRDPDGTLIELVENLKIYYIDIDGVLCNNTNGKYEDALPNKENIKKINRLYDNEHTIILWTARGTTTGKDWSDLTLGQMGKWGVKYHFLKFGKPQYDYIVDDKSVNISDLR